VEILLSIKQEEEKAKQQNRGITPLILLILVASDTGDRKLRQIFKKPKREQSKGLLDEDDVV